MTVVNVGLRLSEMARGRPHEMAVAMPVKRPRGSATPVVRNGRSYQQLTFQQLDEDSSRIAAGLRELGAGPGVRLALLVPPGIDFISLVFALFKSGAVTVLIDPGMGRSNLVRCLQEADVAGFIGIPLVHAVRSLLRWKFPRASLNVTAGRRWWWGGATLERLRRTALGSYQPAQTAAEDPAAVIFTTGSTGPPKGVLYRHGNFNQQVDEIRDRYQIQPGEIDLPGFPLFALFNCAMGVGTVIPDMDFTRPADVDPLKFLAAAEDWSVTQSFGSPALWNTVGRYCEQHGRRLPTLRRVLSAGAPVPPQVIRRVLAAIHPDGQMHTPYGATEALPVASIAGSQVLEETAAATARGAGVCVGAKFPGIQWRVIRIEDGPLPEISDAVPVAPGEIGELMVRGGVVTGQYATRLDCNPLHKVRDGDTIWHRMGDVGYLDEQQRFWFCGRKSHRVQTAEGTLFTIPCESIFNQHPAVYRTALVGLSAVGEQQPVLIVECLPGQAPAGPEQRAALFQQLRDLGQLHPQTRSIDRFLVHEAMPVDIRHNSKIFREQLAVWAARQRPVAVSQP